jgi:hypothetical protein
MRSERDRCARGHENIDFECEKFGDERRHALRVSVGVALFEY